MTLKTVKKKWKSGWLKIRQDLRPLRLYFINLKTKNPLEGFLVFRYFLILLIMRNPVHQFLPVLVKRPCVPLFKKRRVSFFELRKKFCGCTRERCWHIFVIGFQKICKCYLYMMFNHSFFVTIHKNYNTTL